MSLRYLMFLNAFFITHTQRETVINSATQCIYAHCQNFLECSSQCFFLSRAGVHVSGMVSLFPYSFYENSGKKIRLLLIIMSSFVVCSKLSTVFYFLFLIKFGSDACKRYTTPGFERVFNMLFNKTDKKKAFWAGRAKLVSSQVDTIIKLYIVFFFFLLSCRRCFRIRTICMNIYNSSSFRILSGETKMWA